MILLFLSRFLNYNSLSWTIEDLSGAFDGLTSLTRLGLSHNAIKSVAARAFQSLESLKQLHLEGNPLTTVAANAFAPMTSLTLLRLNSSALVCDCQLDWFAEWVKRKGFQDTVIAKCAHPDDVRGKSVMEVSKEHFQCGEWFFFFIIIIMIEIFIFFCNAHSLEF